jgi:hypothetical protein
MWKVLKAVVVSFEYMGNNNHGEVYRKPRVVGRLVDLLQHPDRSLQKLVFHIIRQLSENQADIQLLLDYQALPVLRNLLGSADNTRMQILFRLMYDIVLCRRHILST